MCAARKRTSSNESSSSKSNLGIPSTRRDPLCPGNEFERENCVHFFLRDHLGSFVPSSLLKLMGEALRISAELQEMRTHFAAVRAGLEQRLAELERAVHRRVRSCARRHRAVSTKPCAVLAASAWARVTLQIVACIAPVTDRVCTPSAAALLARTPPIIWRRWSLPRTAQVLRT